MELIRRERIEPLIPSLKILCVVAAFGFTGILAFKDLYFYTWEEKKETILYSIPMVFFFFMWIKYRLEEKNVFQHQLILTDSAAVILSAARILGLFWHSGHVLFILYTLLTSKNKIFRVICIPFILLTVGMKIYWGDVLTPIFGIILALFLVSIRKWFEMKMNKQSLAK